MTGTYRNTQPQAFFTGNLQCLLCVHADDTKGAATKETAESSLKHLNSKVGQCKADCNSSRHTGIQHEHSPGAVLTHQHVCIDGITPVDSGLLTGKDEDAVRDVALHEAYKPVPGAVAWIALTRAELAVHVQALQRRAHAPRIVNCKRLNTVTRHMERHKCG